MTTMHPSAPPPGAPVLHRFIHRFEVDRTLVMLLLLLSAISTLTLLSVVEQEQTAILARHAVRFAIGFALLFVFSAIPVEVYRRWSVFLYLVCIALLLLVLGVGEISKGAQRWLDIWLVRFQPSEILKIATPLLLCSILAEQNDHRPNGGRTMLAIALLTIPVALVALQPDLGTALLIAVSGLFALFLAGLSWYWLASMLVAIPVSAPLIWHTLHEYQRQRALAFLNPESDPLGAGYHIIQSKIAIGSGGLWGKGWGNGTQVPLGFIPEHSTDFIFAAFAEQFGFAGACALILVYLAVCVRGVLITVHAADRFGWLLTGTFIFSFAVYAMINIAMVSGLLPVVGVPLPLVSYGGTATVTTLASFGILIAVAKHRPMMRYAP